MYFIYRYKLLDEGKFFYTGGAMPLNNLVYTVISCVTIRRDLFTEGGAVHLNNLAYI